MRYAQILTFEISAGCDLALKHKGRCPNLHPERWNGTTGRRPLTDDLIISICKEAYENHGFGGFIGWHFYNEPLLSWDRIKPLMVYLKDKIPSVRFLLWSNGTHLPEPLDQLLIFSQLHITNYGEADLKCFNHFPVPGRIFDPIWDSRRNVCLTHQPTSQGCIKPFSEFIINYFGQIMLCCYDWRGEVQIGNVHDEPFSDLVARWQTIRYSIVGHVMSETAPDRCRRCVMKHDDLGFIFDEDINDRCKSFL